MSPRDLLDHARAIAEADDRALGQTRTVAAALLLRQALEESLDDVWERTVPALAGVNGRAQLISLPYYLQDADLSADVVYAWNRLSTICHHDAYELPPHADEVRAMAATVERLTRWTPPG
ncbi:MAG: hypothetical protein S0880_08700 [Actinomycetota bacterium]|nr:hypothetical protein [Actinomycetota bacterium]